MGGSSGKLGTYGDEEHGLRNVDAALEVICEAPPAGHLSEAAFRDPRTGQNLETLRFIPAANDLAYEVQVSRLFHRVETVIDTIGKQMLYPWPVLADRIQDQAGSGTVVGVGRGQVHHQQTPVCINRD